MRKKRKMSNLRMKKMNIWMNLMMRRKIVPFVHTFQEHQHKLWSLEPEKKVVLERF